MRALVAADSALPATKAFDSTLAAVGGNPEGRGGFGGFGAPRPSPTFVGVNGTLTSQLNALENGDMAPTPSMLAAYAGACTDLKTVVTNWLAANGAALTAFNAALTQAGLKPVAVASPAMVVPDCAAAGDRRTR